VIDWPLVAKVAGGGFGVTILVLTILSVVLWLIGMVMTRIESNDKKAEEEK